ncbi:DUF905 family protein [Enterobacter sp.]|nr:DUF905 family protein [Enterobacter sp.]
MEAVTTAYRNIRIADDKRGHFRLAVCDPEGQMVL